MWRQRLADVEAVRVGYEQARPLVLGELEMRLQLAMDLSVDKQQACERCVGAFEAFLRCACQGSEGDRCWVGDGEEGSIVAGCYHWLVVLGYAWIWRAFAAMETMDDIRVRASELGGANRDGAVVEEGKGVDVQPELDRELKKRALHAFHSRPSFTPILSLASCWRLLKDGCRPAGWQVGPERLISRCPRDGLDGLDPDDHAAGAGG